VTVENTTQNIPFAYSVNGSEPVQDLCSVVCYLEPNSTSDIAVSSVWSEDGALEYMGMVDLIKLSIRAEQVD
jgi:Fe-S cluster assembly scaffold protein SufB